MIKIKSNNNQGFIGQIYLANLLKWQRGQRTHAFAHTVKCLHLPVLSILFVNTQLVKHALPDRVSLNGLLQCFRNVNMKKPLLAGKQPVGTCYLISFGCGIF